MTVTNKPCHAAMFARLFFILCLISCTTSVPALPQWQWQDPGKVVAFGDVHGAYPELVYLLEELNIIDNEGNWSAGDTHLVSLGDLIDRGGSSRKVLDLIMKLQQQAGAAGGAVHVIMGNHEAMVMTGDWRYISRQEFAAYIDNETEQEREVLFQHYLKQHPGLADSEARTKFDKDHPPGFSGLIKAFGVKLIMVH